MPGTYPSLAELARNNPDQYRSMSVGDRLAMVQQPYFADKSQMSEADLGLLELLSNRYRREQARDNPRAPQIAPQAESPGFLQSLFQMFSGRQAVDPLAPLKQPGYSGPPS